MRPALVYNSKVNSLDMLLQYFGNRCWTIDVRRKHVFGEPVHTVTKIRSQCRWSENVYQWVKNHTRIREQYQKLGH